MKPDERTVEEKQAELKTAYAIIMCFIASILAVGVAIVAGVAGPYLEPTIGFRFTWWMGLLLGFSIGLVVGFFKARSESKRSSLFSAESAKLGYRPLSLDDIGNVSRNIKMMFASKSVRLMDTHFKAKKGAIIVVAELGIEDSFDNDSSESDETIQTCCYIEFSNRQFPEFDLEPKTAAFSLLKKLVRVRELKFDGTPFFSKHYKLQGKNATEIRSLFNDDVRQSLERKQGWTIRGKKNRLLFYRQSKLLGSNQLKEMLQTALPIAKSLAVAAVDVPRSAAKEELTPNQNGNSIAIAEAMAEVDQLEGLAGGIISSYLKRKIKQNLIDKNGVSSFLKESIPRPMPPQLKSQLKIDTFFVILFSTFILVGMLVALIGGVATFQLQEKLISYAIGGSVALIGALAIMFAKIREGQRFRILTHGKIRLATIQSVTESPFISGNQRIWNANLRFEDGNREQLKMRIKSFSLAAAQELAESKARTRVLQDQKHVNRILLVDCHAS